MITLFEEQRIAQVALELYSLQAEEGRVSFKSQHIQNAYYQVIRDIQITLFKIAYPNHITNGGDKQPCNN
jgi:hypothetical protein